MWRSGGLATFTLAKWRKKAISMYGKARGLTKAKRAEVTSAVHGTSSSKKSKSPTGPTRKKKRNKTVAKKKRVVRKSNRIIGSLGVKGLLVGLGALTVAKFVARRFLGAYGAYADGAAMIGASFVPFPGTKNLRGAGIMELGSEFIADLLAPGGAVTIPSISSQGGGYDF